MGTPQWTYRFLDVSYGMGEQSISCELAHHCE